MINVNYGTIGVASQPEVEESQNRPITPALQAIRQSNGGGSETGNIVLRVDSSEITSRSLKRFSALVLTVGLFLLAVTAIMLVLAFLPHAGILFVVGIALGIIFGFFGLGVTYEGIQLCRRSSQQLQNLINDETCNDIQLGSYPNLAEHPQFQMLSTFIDRLPEIADFKNKNTRPQVIRRIREILEHAEQNEEFRNILFNEVQEGTSDCADRPTYCFSRIIAELAPSKAEAQGTMAVREALFDLERIKAIEEYATELSSGESIEAALWLRLQVLPDSNGIQHMTHSGYATSGIGLGEEHVKEANRRILAVTDSTDKQIAIIAKSSYFRKKCENMPGYLAICDKAAERLEEHPDKIDEITKDQKKAVDEFIHQEAAFFIEDSNFIEPLSYFGQS